MMVCSGIGWNLLRLSFGKNIQTFFEAAHKVILKFEFSKEGIFQREFFPGIQLMCSPDRCLSGREVPCQLSLRMELGLLRFDA